MANLKEAFVIRPTDTDENEFIITIGNHLATEEKFKSRKAAEMRMFMHLRKQTNSKNQLKNRRINNGKKYRQKHHWGQQ